MVLFTKAQRRRISLWMVSMATVCNTSAAVTDVYRIEWNHLCCKPTLRVLEDQNTCATTWVDFQKEFNHDKDSGEYWMIQFDNSATWEGHKLERTRKTGPPYQTTLIWTQSQFRRKRKKTSILCSCESSSITFPLLSATPTESLWNYRFFIHPLACILLKLSYNNTCRLKVYVPGQKGQNILIIVTRTHLNSCI